MKKFTISKILIPIDFSETSLLAIEHAAFMAKLYKAELLLVHIVEQTWGSFSVVEPVVRVEDESDLAKQIEQKLLDLAENIRSRYGVKSKVLCTSGHISDEVVAIAKEYHVDLIVMGTHGVSGIAEFFIGSNAYKVVTMANCPVLSVQTHAKRLGFENLVLPIDNSDHSRQKVNHAVVLAKLYQCKVNVLGLLSANDDEETTNKFQIKLDQIIDYLKKHDVVYSCELMKTKNHAQATMQYAEKIKSDMIVIMTDQDAEGLFLSSFAQQIVNHSKIPVLSITPEEHPENIPWVHPY